MQVWANDRYYMILNVTNRVQFTKIELYNRYTSSNYAIKDEFSLLLFHLCMCTTFCTIHGHVRTRPTGNPIARAFNSDYEPPLLTISDRRNCCDKGIQLRATVAGHLDRGRSTGRVFRSAQWPVKRAPA